MRLLLRSKSARFTDITFIFTDRSRPILSSRVKGLVTDQGVLDAALAMLNAKLDGYEVILGKQKYLAGDVRSESTILYTECVGVDLDM